MKSIYFWLLLVSLFIVACKETDKTDEDPSGPESTLEQSVETTVAEKIARAHGIEHWNKVTQVNFTFKVSDSTGTIASRKWEWQPKEDKIRFFQQDSILEFNRKPNLAGEPKETDKKFINDVYWLLPYFKLVWDDGLEIAEVNGENQSAIIASYEGSGGYTPHDRYLIRYGKNLMFQEWEYYPSGAEEPRMVTTFEDYRDYNGIKIAHLHRVAQTDVRITFEDVDFKFEE